jgi:hypothetical protein
VRRAKYSDELIVVRFWNVIAEREPDWNLAVAK